VAAMVIVIDHGGDDYAADDGNCDDNTCGKCATMTMITRMVLINASLASSS
jgi:hypothetical protein